jgi:leucyl aminopeptidase (aminopeptidase T)
VVGLKADYSKEIQNTVRNALRIGPAERVAIVFDDEKSEIALAFSIACMDAGAEIVFLKVKGLSETKREPVKEIVRGMRRSDVVLGITSVSLTHTDAVRSALKAGARVATMPGITKALYPALAVDYKKMGKVCRRLASKFKHAHNARITTKKGTDLVLWFAGRKIEIDDGLLDKKGSLHNLPAGEVGVAPLENSADGRIVVDICMAGVNEGRRLEKPITISLCKGRISSIDGGEEAKILRKVFGKAKKNADTIAEFSIGTNSKASPIGNVLNDEKAYGTCHFAFGDNLSLGGSTHSNIHLDGVVNEPTILFDGKIVMKEGKLV